MIENVKNGMTIYFYRDLESYVIKGKVKDSSIIDASINNIKVIKKVDWKNTVNGEGEEVREIGGTSGVRLDKAFLTAKEANDAQDAEIKQHKEELRSEITDIESLLKFPLKHCLIGDEYTDSCARHVYLEYIEKYRRGELK